MVPGRSSFDCGAGAPHFLPERALTRGLKHFQPERVTGLWGFPLVNFRSSRSSWVFPPLLPGLNGVLLCGTLGSGPVCG